MKYEQSVVCGDIAMAITCHYLEAWAYIPKRRSAHRNVKPKIIVFGENSILKDGYIEIEKRTAFGLACARDPTALMIERTSFERNSTTRYKDPEIVMDNSYVLELANVWSVSVILYPIIAHCNPCTSKFEKEVVKRIECGSLF